MIADGYTGRKGKGGFYRLVRNGGDKRKEAIDLATGDYRPAEKPVFESANADAQGLARPCRAPRQGRPVRLGPSLSRVLAYTASLLPEIAGDITAVDAAMKAGYAWKYGPFEQIDQLGTAWFAERLEADGIAVPALIQTAAGRPLYREEDGRRQYLTMAGDYADIVAPDDAWQLADKKRGAEPIASKFLGQPVGRGRRRRPASNSTAR